MSSTAKVAGENHVSVKEKQLLPPEEKFWVRYSPHHEFSLSTVASIGAHVLVLALLIFGGILAARLGFGEGDKPLPVDVISIEGGGGGSPDGEGLAPGDLPPKGGTEAVANANENVGKPPEKTPKNELLEEAKADPLTLPEVANSEGRIIDESNAAIKQLAQIDKDARKDLFNGLKAGKGQGGSGEGGGKGGGKGTGEGSGVGPGKQGQMNTRQKRVLRWLIDFQVSSVEDHLRQFAGLGAVLAVPVPDGGFFIFRDLNRRPPTGQREDISKLNRIWFTESYKERPENVAGLARALGIAQPPPYIVALFPQKLEEQMAKMEENFRGKKEEDIHQQIVFQVRPFGGSYRVVIGDNQR